jgi:hypothetical protein
MSFLNFLLKLFSIKQFSFSYVSAFTDYDEDGYPIEDEWDDDEDEDNYDDEDEDEDDFNLSDPEETEWE